MKPKVYHLKKGQLRMVKNAKMFKERFDGIKNEIRNTFKNTSDTRINQTEPSDDTIAQLILAEIVPSSELRALVKSNLDKGRYTSGNDLDDVLFQVYPEKVKKYKIQLRKENKDIVHSYDKNVKRLESLHTELSDKVLFNGLDPLEAIKTLQAFKEE